METELSKIVKETVKMINGLKTEEIPEFVDSALDIMVEKYVNGKEYVGFSMLLAYGGPNIEFTYHRGVAKVIAAWGSAKAEEYVDTKVAEEILNYLNEMAT